MALTKEESRKIRSEVNQLIKANQHLSIHDLELFLKSAMSKWRFNKFGKVELEKEVERRKDKPVDEEITEEEKTGIEALIIEIINRKMIDVKKDLVTFLHETINPDQFVTRDLFDRTIRTLIEEMVTEVKVDEVALKGIEDRLMEHFKFFTEQITARVEELKKVVSGAVIEGTTAAAPYEWVDMQHFLFQSGFFNNMSLQKQVQVLTGAVKGLRKYLEPVYWIWKHRIDVPTEVLNLSVVDEIINLIIAMAGAPSTKIEVLKGEIENVRGKDQQ